jgi:carboxypeptidase T
MKKLAALGILATILGILSCGSTDPGQGGDSRRHYASLEDPDFDPGSLPDIDPTYTGILGYGAYRTVEETKAALSAMVAAYPGFAAVIDIGDSWEKASPGGNAGYDIEALKLTNSGIASDKPKVLIVAGLEPASYPGPQLALEFAQWLLSRREVDADAAMLLDSNEFHFIFFANPDGRKMAETGFTWFKNTNNNYAANTNYRGANLNHNFAWQWGAAGGSSGTAANQDYRGPSAASEPETQAMQNYLRACFPDRRSADLAAPAPLDVKGMVIELKGYGGIVSWPWCFSSAAAPNAGLATIGRRLASFNGYAPMQSYSLLASDGTFISAAYGELGVPAVAIYLGDEYFVESPVYRDDIVPDNMKALIYAARIAGRPYAAASGPLLTGLSIAGGERLSVSLTADDSRFGVSSGEAVDSIATLRYGIDSSPEDEPSAAVQLAAADGSYDSPSESASFEIDAGGLDEGRHVLYLQASDSSGARGPLYARYFYIDQRN